MAYEIDVLITYADKDNELGKKNEVGWVTQFKKFIDMMLVQVLGEKVNVVMKGEHDDFTAAGLSNVAVMVAILTKDFAQSGRCLDTLESFYKSAEGSKVERVFKVLKSPLSNPEQPPRLRELLNYDMYQLDNETGLMKEYSDFFSQDAEKQYWMKMVDLVYDIHESLIILKGQTKTEVKNMNSFANVERALAVERDRQVRLVESGGRVEQVTMLFNAASGEVRPMRSKEESHDYRYFPDPDLPPLVLTRLWIEQQHSLLPEMPDAKRDRFMTVLGLPPYDAGVLSAERPMADYYEAVVAEGADPKTAANWVMTEVLRGYNETGEFSVSAKWLAGLLAEIGRAHV